MTGLTVFEVAKALRARTAIDAVSSFLIIVFLFDKFEWTNVEFGYPTGGARPVERKAQGFGGASPI